MEARTYRQNISYLDRLDYWSPMNQRHAFCLAMERFSAWRRRAAGHGPSLSRSSFRGRDGDLNPLDIVFGEVDR